MSAPGPLLGGGPGSAAGVRDPDDLRACAVWKLAAATAVLVAIAGPGFLWSRFQTDPLAVRRELVASSLAMFRERPWMGFGLGTWPTAYPAYATFDPGVFANHAHCDWAEWAAEGGLPFLAAAAALASAAVIWSGRRRWGIGVAAVFAHALVDYPLQKPALAALTFTLLGALAADARGKGPTCSSS